LNGKKSSFKRVGEWDRTAVMLCTYIWW
jgi:hypothetical protein